MKRLVSALLIAGLFASATASANVLVNGGFDTGDFIGWTTYNSANGVSSPAVTSADVTGLGASLAAQFMVGERVFSRLYEGGGIRQAFSVAGGMVSISADIASVGDNFGQNNGGGRYELFLDGILLDMVDVGTIDQGEVVRNTLSFSGLIGSGLHELNIFMSRPYTSVSETPRQYIDNVDVTLAADVPEPGTTVLFGLGLAAACVAMRRARN